MKLFRLLMGSADQKAVSENLYSSTKFMKDCRSIILCIREGIAAQREDRVSSIINY